MSFLNGNTASWHFHVSTSASSEYCKNCCENLLTPLLAINHNSSQEACPRHSLLLCTGKNLRKNANSFQKMSRTRCTMKNDKTLKEENGPQIQITAVSPAPGCWLPRTRGITHNQSKFGENIYAAKRLASGHEILAKTDHTPGHWADQQPISGEGGIGVLWWWWEQRAQLNLSRRNRKSIYNLYFQPEEGGSYRCNDLTKCVSIQ